MLDKNQLCEKIREIYPDIGQCGIDVHVRYDDEQRCWVVGLEKDHHYVKTYLEEGDAELCLVGEQCVRLGLEINQLRDTVERYPG